MDNNNENLLLIAEIGEVKTSSDNRNYRVVRFQKAPKPGILSNAKVRTRVLWNEGPNGSPGDRLYQHIEDGTAKVGSKVYGSIESIEVEEYFIPNENGKYTDPETNMPANKGDRFTGVVFEDESIESVARSNGRKIPGDLPEEEQPATTAVNATIDEDLVED